MTTETAKILRTWAKEDIKIAMDNESMMITDTKKGNISLNYEEGTFEVYDFLGEKLFNGDIKETTNYLINIYTVN